MPMAINMTDQTGLLRLMAWLSPVFPTGGFSYSSGLETAVQSGQLADQEALRHWLKIKLDHGSLRNDAILLAEAWRSCANPSSLADVTELALSRAGCRERYLELTAQADAFAATIKHWPDLSELDMPKPCAICVAVGAVAGFARLDLSQTLIAYLHSIVSSQAQAAIRLSLVGQSGAAQILAQLEPSIVTAAEFAEQSSLDDLGSATIAAEVMAMNHEYLPGRMFRS